MSELYETSKKNSLNTDSADSANSNNSTHLNESDNLQNDFLNLKQHLAKHIIGQEHLLDRLLIALLADGHILVEGAPGLAKTKAIKSLSQYIACSFQRIQFTPDLLPTDITGTEIYRAQTGEFSFEKGPVFHNLILADEINRAPAKAQSALLEAMAERQVTIGRKTYPLPELFLVMATQNPIEQQGTYPLPEAQLDRFLMHINIDYPDLDTEKQILKCVQIETIEEINHVKHSLQTIAIDKIIHARKMVLDVHVSASIEEYILHLIMATRQPEKYLTTCQQYIEFGASPRATIALARCSRAVAWLNNRDYVIPEDVKSVFPDILRHRIILNYVAEAEGITNDDCILEILEKVAVV